MKTQRLFCSQEAGVNVRIELEAFFSDLTYNIYFLFEKQALNGLSNVIGIQKGFMIFL